MEQTVFYHALKIRQDLCIGCTHCMKVCPTEAIRVEHGKAVLFEHRCVDCGECFRACPVCAIIIEQDDFDKIFDYPVRVALVPSVFIGQFPEEISTEEIYSELMEIGFTHVFEVEHGVEILESEINKYIAEHREIKPAISPYCPAIVRLIQVKFPALVENFVLLKQPVDVAAIYSRKKFLDAGFRPEEIGLFYISPCAAKIAAVKSPVGEKVSAVTGVINMNLVFNKVYTGLKQAKRTTCKIPFRKSLKAKGIEWSLTRGESVNASGRSLAIDGIHNVIEFLEKLENDERMEIDFLELRACDESCAGGVLTTGNRFLTAERLHKRADMARKKQASTLPDKESIKDYREYITERIKLEKIKPRSMMKLDDNMVEAMKKMQKVHELLLFLPSVDCGACGSPGCNALAEDVVQGRATIAKCIFVQRALESRKVLSFDETFKAMKDTWGEDKFNKKWQVNL